MCQNHQFLNMGCSQALALLVVLIYTISPLAFALKTALAERKEGGMDWLVYYRVYHLPSGCGCHPPPHENSPATLVRREQEEERRSLLLGPIRLEGANVSRSL